MTTSLTRRCVDDNTHSTAHGPWCTAHPWGRDRPCSDQRISKQRRNKRDDHPPGRFVFDLLRFARQYRHDHEPRRGIPILFFHESSGRDNNGNDHDIRLTGPTEQPDPGAGATLYPQWIADASVARCTGRAVFLRRHVIIRVARQRGPFRSLGLLSFIHVAFSAQTSVEGMSLFSFTSAEIFCRPSKFPRTC